MGNQATIEQMSNNLAKTPYRSTHGKIKVISGNDTYSFKAKFVPRISERSFRFFNYEFVKSPLAPEIMSLLGRDAEVLHATFCTQKIHDNFHVLGASFQSHKDKYVSYHGVAIAQDRLNVILNAYLDGDEETMKAMGQCVFEVQNQIVENGNVVATSPMADNLYCALGGADDVKVIGGAKVPNWFWEYQCFIAE